MSSLAQLPAKPDGVLISIIMPMLNESASVQPTLMPLQPFRHQGCEVIVVDGGSDDDSCSLAEPLCDRLIQLGSAQSGRANQMNEGADVAQGQLLVFLHADTRMEGSGVRQLFALAAQGQVLWGRFSVKLEASHSVYRLIERLINLRSRMTGIATGDQAIFVRRALFEKINRYPLIPLMEDVALSRRLGGVARPLCLKHAVVTSARRWQSQGVVRTIVLMWWLRFAFWLGVDPHRLARWYRVRKVETDASS